MLMNNLDPEVAENPDALVVYGGTGRAARSWEAFDAIVRELRRLADDETLLVQSGKPVAVFRTHEWAPRVLIANSNLVGRWATWEHFRELERQGLMMYGQMTAGSWIYIGTQGILQGTFETFAELARQHFGGTLRGPRDAHGGPRRDGRRPAAGRDDERRRVPRDRGRRVAGGPARSRSATSTGSPTRRTRRSRWPGPRRRTASRSRSRWSATPPRSSPRGPRAGERFDVVTDQTSAHDALGGYVPAEISLDDAAELRRTQPDVYEARSTALDGRPRPRDARVPGGRRRRLRLRQQPAGPGPGGGRRERVRLPGVRAGVHPAAVLRGPRAVPVGRALGRPGGHRRAPTARCSSCSPTTRACGAGSRWPRRASRSRACRPASAGWATASARRPASSSTGSSPRARSRRRSSSGATTSTRARSPRPTARPRRWPTAPTRSPTGRSSTRSSTPRRARPGCRSTTAAAWASATASTPAWSCVADGTELAARKLERVLTTDPGMGVVRHVDAGYERAIEVARERGVRIPMLDAG